MFALCARKRDFERKWAIRQRFRLVRACLRYRFRMPFFYDFTKTLHFPNQNGPSKAISSYLGASWAPKLDFGPLKSCPGRVQGPLWGHSGVSWGPPGAIWARCCNFGVSWGSSWGPLGRPDPILDHQNRAQDRPKAAPRCENRDFTKVSCMSAF